jgi:hypothetical protein
LTAVRTYVRMCSCLPHISFARAEAARQAGDLGWILAYKGQISMNSEYELGVLELIEEQDPEHKLDGSAEFAERVRARGDRPEPGR